MLSFLRLVQNENMKLYKRKILWIMIGILVGIVIVSLVITLNTKDMHSTDWKEYLNLKIQENQKELSDSRLPEAFKERFKEDINIKKYHIKHNIPPLYNDTAIGFVNSTLKYSGLITLFIIIISSSIVSQEYSWGTIKLVLMRPVKRWVVLLSKYISVIYNSLVLFVVLILISFFIGSIIFGFNDTSLRYVYAKQGDINDVSIFTHFIQYIGSKLVGIIVITAFAFMLSTILRNNAVAIALSIFIQFSGSVISDVLISFDNNFTKYIFFINMDLYQYVEGSPPEGMTLGFSIVVLFIYLLIFIGISTAIFERRDV
ncbi:ABC transporter permease [Bacillus haynesii]|uniref:ABC transporter permease subunit n=1 Tax=Bacillus haynesii TaxID=1925021 RepID=UPI00227EE0C5|nr:ABC transporter permease subunit [Bacillus haynesii]MCY8005447.1 ABC transporter permease [Bacillus haynesii]